MSCGGFDDQGITTTFRKKKYYFIDRWNKNKILGKMEKDPEDGLPKARIQKTKQNVYINLWTDPKPINLSPQKMFHVQKDTVKNMEFSW